MKLALLAFLVLLTACAPEPIVTKPNEAQRLVDSMEYVKAKNGLCFGVVTVQRTSSNLTVAINQMIVHVPC